MEGYAKMNTVTKSNGHGTFNITLNGDLGRLFQELKKITFDTTYEDPKYIINGGNYVSGVIDKNLVKASWESNGQTTSSLSDSAIIDIIGFAPNNSFNDEFDYTTYQVNTFESKTFVDTLTEKEGWSDLGIDSNSVIPDGLLPREIGEFRSYLQTPFIYWNKFFQIFKEKGEELTGYTFDLDEDWFNESNPYWYNLVYMLKAFDVKSGEEHPNIYTSVRPENYYATWGASGYFTEPLSSDYIMNGQASETVPIYNQYPSYQTHYTCPEGYDNIVYKNNFTMYFQDYAGNQFLKPDNALLVSISMVGENGHRQTNNYIVRGTDSELTYQDYKIISVNPSLDDDSRIYFNIESDFRGNRNLFGEYVYFENNFRFLYNTYPYGHSGAITRSDVTIGQQKANLNVLLFSKFFRSNASFTLNDLWDSNYNIFDQILNYCKMYRILIFTDSFEKKLKFIPATKYFSNYTIEDWTDKVDMEGDFVITPVTFDNKYVLFNYDDSDTKLGQNYEKKFKFGYGEKNLITSYNFNTETTELFENVKSSMVNTDTSLSWNNLYNLDIRYSVPNEIFPYSKDENNKFVDNFGQFYFHKGKRNFNTESILNMRSVIISDDTIFQQSYMTFYYSQDMDGVRVYTYPDLDVVYNNQMCLFNTPNENYTYLNNYGGTDNIYSLFWKYYLDERYNVQNKLITCYLNLTPKDFIEFEYNRFIKIDNNLYMVNKIYDYDILTNNTTKVDLISIQQADSYIVNDFIDYLEVDDDTVTLRGAGDTKSITVNAYNDLWSFEVISGNASNVEIERVGNHTLNFTSIGDETTNFTIKLKSVGREAILNVYTFRNRYIIVTDMNDEPLYEISAIVGSGYTTKFKVHTNTRWNIGRYDAEGFKFTPWYGGEYDLEDVYEVTFELLDNAQPSEFVVPIFETMPVSLKWDLTIKII